MEQDKQIAVQAAPYNMTPANLEEAKEIATLVAESGMVPKDYVNKPPAVLVAMQMGQELGLQPLQALQNIAVINGRPSIWGDAALAIVMKHPRFIDCIEEMSDDGTAARCILKIKDRADVVRQFTREDATVAGLWGKTGPWTQYPKRMLQMRARSVAIRDAFPDALRGLSIGEESQDIEMQRGADGSFQHKQPSSAPQAPGPEVVQDETLIEFAESVAMTYAGAAGAVVLKALHSTNERKVLEKAEEVGASREDLDAAMDKLREANTKASERFTQTDK
jgi:hypothetical protein